MEQDYRILGTTGDVTMCDCCGRMDLTKTVVIEINDEINHYGVVCAAHILKFDSKEISRLAKSADKTAADDARRLEIERRRRVENHPLYLKGIEIRNELVKEFGFFSRCPKNDPRYEWGRLLAQANAETA